MKLVIFLNGERGVSVLKHLLSTKEFDNPIVVTTENFDIKKYSLPENKILHLMFANVNSKQCVKKLSSFSPDVFLIAGFPTIFSDNLLAIPALGCINLHGGKLPEYRGGSPLNWQMIMGESQVGISALLTDSGIDTGNILCEELLDIEDEDTIKEIHNKVNKKFPDLALAAIDKLANKQKGIEQDEAKATYWHQRNDADGYIDFRTADAIEVCRLVKAITRPYPGAWGRLDNSKIRIFKAHISSVDIRGVPGKVVFLQGTGPFIVCKDKAIQVDEYTLEDTDSPLIAGVVLE